jgi:hypothetical protein
MPKWDLHGVLERGLVGLVRLVGFVWLKFWLLLWARRWTFWQFRGKLRIERSGRGPCQRFGVRWV